MEKERNPKRLQALALVLLAGSTALFGCAKDTQRILGDIPAEIISENNKGSRFITAEESGGYPHYETIYTFILKQCERPKVAIADDQGCVTLGVRVDKITFDDFDPGQNITFKEDRYAFVPTEMPQ